MTTISNVGGTNIQNVGAPANHLPVMLGERAKLLNDALQTQIQTVQNSNATITRYQGAQSVLKDVATYFDGMGANTTLKDVLGSGVPGFAGAALEDRLDATLSLAGLDSRTFLGVTDLGELTLTQHEGAISKLGTLIDTACDTQQQDMLRLKIMGMTTTQAYQDANTLPPDLSSRPPVGQRELY